MLQNLKSFQQKSKFALSTLTSFVHLDDPYVLDWLFVNKRPFVTLISSHAFCLVYDFWQWVYVIHWFLFSCYKGIYKYKHVNSISTDSYTFIHYAKILFSLQESKWITLRIHSWSKQNSDAKSQWKIKISMNVLWYFNLWMTKFQSLCSFHRHITSIWVHLKIFKMTLNIISDQSIFLPAEDFLTPHP